MISFVNQISEFLINTNFAAEFCFGAPKSAKMLVSGTSHDNSAPRQRAVFWKFTKWRSGLFRNSKNKF